MKTGDASGWCRCGFRHGEIAPLVGSPKIWPTEVFMGNFTTALMKIFAKKRNQLAMCRRFLKGKYDPIFFREELFLLRLYGDA